MALYDAGAVSRAANLSRQLRKAGIPVAYTGSGAVAPRYHVAVSRGSTSDEQGAVEVVQLPGRLDSVVEMVSDALDELGYTHTESSRDVQEQLGYAYARIRVQAGRRTR